VQKSDAGEESLNTRGERLFQVLAQDKKFTVADMIDLGFDTYIVAADVIVPLLRSAYAAHPPADGRIRTALRHIERWDRRAAKESVAYTYVYYWGKSYGNLSRFLSYDRKKKVDIESPEEQEKARAALEEAVRRIGEQFGKTEVPWGEINVVTRGGEFPLGGTGLFGVLHPDEGVVQDDGRIHCNDGWGHLLIVVESDPKQIWSLLPYGQSENPSSPNYNDQAKLHSEQKVKRFWFTAEDILSHTRSVRGDRNRIRKLLRNQETP
jgi:acyl-homoserine lactone acylase PvdQ